MRGKLSLYILVLSLFGSGCALLSEGVHVVSHELGYCVDDVLERIRNRKWAEAAWQDVCKTDGQHHCTDDYAHGFKDGFAECLYRGGDGEPPAVPPSKYRRFRYQTPEGYKAIEDWFAGYRYGSLVARESNCRRWITGPVAATYSRCAKGACAPIPTYLAPPIPGPTISDGTQGAAVPSNRALIGLAPSPSEREGSAVSNRYPAIPFVTPRALEDAAKSVKESPVATKESTQATNKNSGSTEKIAAPVEEPKKTLPTLPPVPGAFHGPVEGPAAKAPTLNPTQPSAPGGTTEATEKSGSSNPSTPKIVPGAVGGSASVPNPHDSTLPALAPGTMEIPAKKPEGAGGSSQPTPIEKAPAESTTLAPGAAQKPVELPAAPKVPLESTAKPQDKPLGPSPASSPMGTGTLEKVPEKVNDQPAVVPGSVEKLPEITVIPTTPAANQTPAPSAVAPGAVEKLPEITINPSVVPPVPGAVELPLQKPMLPTLPPAPVVPGPVEKLPEISVSPSPSPSSVVPGAVEKPGEKPGNAIAAPVGVVPGAVEKMPEITVSPNSAPVGVVPGAVEKLPAQQDTQPSVSVPMLPPGAEARTPLSGASPLPETPQANPSGRVPVTGSPMPDDPFPVPRFGPTGATAKGSR